MGVYSFTVKRLDSEKLGKAASIKIDFGKANVRRRYSVAGEPNTLKLLLTGETRFVLLSPGNQTNAKKLHQINTDMCSYCSSSTRSSSSSQNHKTQSQSHCLNLSRTSCSRSDDDDDDAIVWDNKIKIYLTVISLIKIEASPNHRHWA